MLWIPEWDCLRARRAVRTVARLARSSGGGVCADKNKETRFCLASLFVRSPGHHPGESLSCDVPDCHPCQPGPIRRPGTDTSALARRDKRPAMPRRSLPYVPTTMNDSCFSIDWHLASMANRLVDPFPPTPCIVNRLQCAAETGTDRPACASERRGLPWARRSLMASSRDIAVVLQPDFASLLRTVIQSSACLVCQGTGGGREGRSAIRPICMLPLARGS